MSTVGLWVLLAIGWLFTLPVMPDSVSQADVSLAVSTLILGYILISMPFDLLGGYVLPKKFGRSDVPLITYLGTWSRGVLVHGLILASVAVAMLWSVINIGAFWGPVLIAGIGMSIQALGQTTLAKLIAAFNTSKSLYAHERLWACEDPGFTGGIAMRSGESILPQHWRGVFVPEELSLVRKRREQLRDSSARVISRYQGMAFNLMGVALTAWALIAMDITPMTVGPLPYLLSWASVSSLWAFLGLITLPVPSQKGSLYADRVWKGEDPQTIRHIVETLDGLQDEEPTRTKVVQEIFHPIPNVETRMNTLTTEQNNMPQGSYHLARHTIYFSWSTLSLMSRAVHCNAGRPHLWVFLPTDG